MISAFKQIRLSGHNLTAVQGTAWDGSSQLRLGFGNSGLAYYSELVGISGYLQDLINTANADVNSINVTGYSALGNLAITGLDGVKLSFNTVTNTIEVNGNSGYFEAITNSLSNRLNQSGTTYYDTFATQTNLFNTGKALSEYNTNYSGWANATYVAKTSQQVFFKNLSPTNLDAYAVMYPVPFLSTPKIIATLEVASNSDVMYNLSVRSIGLEGYTGILSDNILEAGAKIHTFASTQV